MIDNENDLNQRLGYKIKSLRSDQGLSLAALAEQSGVSRAMLSLIERGETSPTAVVLEKVASALSVSLASLFEHSQAEPNPLMRASDRTSWRDPASGYTRTNLSPPGFPSPMQLVEVELPAQARVSFASEPSTRGFYHQFWLLSGRLQITKGEQTYTLQAGDCLALYVDHATHFYNPLKKKSHYLVVIARP